MRGVPPRIGPRGLYVRPSRLHGLGVFAASPKRARQVLEISPVLVVPQEQVAALEQTSLGTYYFQWPLAGAALALGYGSLFNHSYHPNALHQLDVDNDLIVFTACAPIAVNEEITINYNGDPADLSAVWFAVVI